MVVNSHLIYSFKMNKQNKTRLIEVETKGMVAGGKRDGGTGEQGEREHSNIVLSLHSDR